jgi:hypothetical protein
MGSLDDAIREHLELKRRLGASDDEIKEKETEAFGKGNRPAPAEPEAAEPPAGQEPLTDDSLIAAEPATNGQHSDPDWEPVDFPSTQRTSTADEIFEPDEVPADESLTVRDERVVHDGPAEDAPLVAPHPDEDVLEETPEFLEETPEQDRLWFEQRPPKDFDFD